jgi:hypothetical protein
MKITVNLNKEESEAFKNFMDTFIPADTRDAETEDQFIKTIFMRGTDALYQEVMERSRKYVEENREQLEKDGVDVGTLLGENPPVEE